MKCFKTIVTCSILLFGPNINAQHGNYSSGARSMGMSNTCITISDAFSPFNNIGALASQKGFTAYSSNAVLYGIPGLLKISAGINMEILQGSGTVNFFRFGDNLLNEQKFGIGYSHKIRFISIGIQIDYIQHKISGYGSTSALGIEFGGVVVICQKLHFGANLFKPLKFYQNPDVIGFLPAILKSGLSYRPADNFLINAEYRHYISMMQHISFGMEYLIREKVSIRTGINIRTLRSSFGLGFSTRKIEIDYAAEVHPLLGISQEITFSVHIKKK